MEKVAYATEGVSRPFQINFLEVTMAKRGDAPGMRGYRTRNNNGLLRDKRDDTRIGTIEKQYGIDLGVRSDMAIWLSN